MNDKERELIRDLEMTKSGRDFLENVELPKHTNSLPPKVNDKVKPYEKINAIIIPKDATNGDMIKAVFNIPDSEIDEGLSTTYLYTNTRVLKGSSQDHLRKQITFNRDWWNAPYESEVEE